MRVIRWGVRIRLPASTNAPATLAAAMSLSVGGQPLAVPTALPQGDAIARIFERLCTEYRLDPKVAKFLVTDAGLESLEDFTHFFTSEQDVAPRVTDKIADLAQRDLQASRLRQAWVAAKQAESISDNRKKRGVEEDDMDALLPKAALSDIGQRFHARYRLSFGVKTEPSDHLVSRLSKELSQRMLQVQSVFKVKTLTHQLRVSRKRQNIADGLVGHRGNG